MSGELLQALMDYVYTGRIRVAKERFQDLQALAVSLEIPSVVALCQRYVSENAEGAEFSGSCMHGEAEGSKVPESCDRKRKQINSHVHDENHPQVLPDGSIDGMTEVKSELSLPVGQFGIHGMAFSVQEAAWTALMDASRMENNIEACDLLASCPPAEIGGNEGEGKEGRGNNEDDRHGDADKSHRVTRRRSERSTKGNSLGITESSASPRTLSPRVRLRDLKPKEIANISPRVQPRDPKPKEIANTNVIKSEGHTQRKRRGNVGRRRTTAQTCDSAVEEKNRKGDCSAKTKRKKSKEPIENGSGESAVDSVIISAEARSQRIPMPVNHVVKLCLDTLPQQFPCNICGKKFALRACVRYHVRLQHFTAHAYRLRWRNSVKIATMYCSLGSAIKVPNQSRPGYRYTCGCHFSHYSTCRLHVLRKACTSQRTDLLRRTLLSELIHKQCVWCSKPCLNWLASQIHRANTRHGMSRKTAKPCVVCGQPFLYPMTMARHVQSVHPQHRLSHSHARERGCYLRWPCNCGARFRFQGSLLSHAKKHHPHVSHSCPKCDYTTPARALLLE